MGNMKDFEVSGVFLPGSISFSNKGFEEPLFPAKTGFFSADLSVVSGTRRWSPAASGVENVFKDEVTQEELVKRDTPPGASCRSCGGLFGAEVHSRQPCVCGPSPGLRPFSGCSAGVSRRQPGANPAGCDRDAASLGDGANRFRRARAFSAAGGFSGARRDVASPGGSGTNLCLRRDLDALAVGAAPLRCAPPAVARLRGQREAEAAGSVVDSDFSSLFQPCMSPIDRHRRVSDVIDGRCTLHARLSTNPCVMGHGDSHHVGHDNSCMRIHAKSRGSSAHWNSRVERGREVSGETKTLSTSILSRVWRPAVGENLPLQQASESLHEEALVGRVNSSNLRISQEMEIKKGCVVTVSHLPTPAFTSSAPCCGSTVRSWLGWTLMGKTDRSGFWLFRGALRGGDVFSSLLASCDWVKKGSYHTAWSVLPLSACSCSYAYGQGPAIGPQTGERCWSLLTGWWRAVAPLMKPWCAEGVLPTAANLNLYQGRFSRVAWHSDNEPLF